jgi:hypothetical protein
MRENQNLGVVPFLVNFAPFIFQQVSASSRLVLQAPRQHLAIFD